MIINLSPVRSEAVLSVGINRDVLLINEESFDFTQLQDGETLPGSAINSQWFAGDVKRIDGVLHVSLVFPHGPYADEAARFPVPINITQDGPVLLPDSGHAVPEQPQISEPIPKEAHEQD